MKKSVRGIILIAIGIFIIVWSLNHKPGNDLQSAINSMFDENSYSMSEPWYYTSLVVGALFSIAGLRDFLGKK
ncbi:hypothetical protein V8G61_11735 [Gaetbulibacter sp. M240]|uniref:hypothetical protein n=1 Tax=Gaetbulibacter sp. M240 TaxID=3126511 RepID=UPI00374F00EB